VATVHSADVEAVTDLEASVEPDHLDSRRTLESMLSSSLVLVEYVLIEREILVSFFRFFLFIFVLCLFSFY
jgi:hypothetical protein